MTVELRGTIADVEDDTDMLNSSIQPGDPFVVQITCDLETRAAQVTSSTASYHQASPSTCMKMTVAGRAFETEHGRPFEMEVRNQDPQDRILARGELRVPPDLQALRWQRHTLLVSLTDDSGRVLADTRLPAKLSFGDWSRASCVLSFVRTARFTGLLYYPAASVVVRGRIESIQKGPNP
jgi:hypothetical protein